MVILARRTQARRVPSTEDGFGSDEARGFPMSPLIEVHGTSSMEKRNIPGPESRPNELRCRHIHSGHEIHYA